VPARVAERRALGTAKGSRLPVEFDVGRLLRPGEENVLAVRVHQWSAGSYLEDQDMWWLSGIFRDVTLLARPPAAIDDVFVHADYDHVTARALRVDADVPARGDGARARRRRRRRARPSRSSGRAVERRAPAALRREVRHRGRAVRCGSASARVVVEDGLLQVNGRRVLLRGVNRHEFDPDRGRAVTEEVMRATSS
jgi:beta-galactosidase